jgi:hypothetical protein
VFDKKHSSRNYGIDANDYVCLSNNQSSISLTRGKMKSRRDNNLMKLKKLRADKVSLERYMENGEKLKMKRGSSLKEKRGSVSVSNNDISMSKLPKLPNINQSSDYNSRLDKLQKAISVNSSHISLNANKLLVRSKPRNVLDLKHTENSLYTNRNKLSTRKL